MFSKLLLCAKPFTKCEAGLHGPCALQSLNHLSLQPMFTEHLLWARCVCSRPWAPSVLSERNRHPLRPPPPALLWLPWARGPTRSNAQTLKTDDFRSEGKYGRGGRDIFWQGRGLTRAHSVFPKQSLRGLGCPRGSTVPQKAGHRQGSESPIRGGLLEGRLVSLLSSDTP